MFALIVQLALLSASSAPQAVVTDLPGFVLWSKGVADGGLNTKLPFENHALSISHRDKDGLVEVHEKFAYTIVVRRGIAALIVGDDVLGPESTEAERFAVSQFVAV